MIKIQLIEGKEDKLLKTKNGWKVYYSDKSGLKHELRHLYKAKFVDWLFGGIYDYFYDTQENLDKFVEVFIILSEMFINRSTGAKINFIQEDYECKTELCRKAKRVGYDIIINKHSYQLRELMIKWLEKENINLTFRDNKPIIKTRRSNEHKT